MPILRCTYLRAFTERLSHYDKFMLTLKQYLDFHSQVLRPLAKNATWPKGYGEVLPESFYELMLKQRKNVNDIFLDLGSGFGRVVLQASAQFEFTQSIGIEIDNTMNDLALSGKEALLKSHPELSLNHERLEFICDDFLTTNYISKANIIWINATAFPPNLFEALQYKLANEATAHTIITTRPFIDIQRFKSYQLHKISTIECSWDSTLAYVYRNLEA